MPVSGLRGSGFHRPAGRPGSGEPEPPPSLARPRALGRPPARPARAPRGRPCEGNCGRPAPREHLPDPRSGSGRPAPSAAGSTPRSRRLAVPPASPRNSGPRVERCPSVGLRAQGLGWGPCFPRPWPTLREDPNNCCWMPRARQVFLYPILSSRHYEGKAVSFSGNFTPVFFLSDKH